MNCEKIVLIGYRGAGKTTVGKALAEVLGYEFFDTDAGIVQLCGCEIQEIVSIDGWDGFRRRERDVLLSLQDRKRVVVATGGGAVVHGADVWKCVRQNACVVWLQADAAALRARIGLDAKSASQRPSLTGEGSACDEVERVLQERTPLYRQFSDIVVAATAPVADIVAQILACCGNDGGK